MAITRNIVNILGGEINVSSEWGKGTTFTVILHLKKQIKNKDVIQELKGLPILIMDDDQAAARAFALS